MIRSLVIALVCSVSLKAMEQEMTVIDAQKYPNIAFQQRERHKKQVYQLFASLIEGRNYQALKPHIRILKDHNALVEMLTYVPKDGVNKKTLRELSDDAVARSTISVMRERILFGLLAALIPTAFLGKLAACPPSLASAELYTAIAGMASAAYMVKHVLYDAYFLKDYEHNNALQIAVALRYHTLVDAGFHQLHQIDHDRAQHNQETQKLFCCLRDAIQRRDLYTVRKILQKTDNDLLYELLCTPNGQGHKPLLEIARHYSKKKVVCDLHHKRARIVSALFMLSIVFIDGYINAFELYNESRACSINRNHVQGTLALVFTLSSFAITFVYFTTQISTVYNRFDQHRARNDALRIYKKMLAATERLMRDHPVNHHEVV